MGSTPLRFGIWALVHGSRASYNDPLEPYDASWDRNRDLILEAERLGFDSTLIAQHTANPRDPERDNLEAWTSAAAIAALTNRIEIIAAIKPLLYHPVVLAKMALQIEHISRGRFAINVVNAWNRAEFEKAGMSFPEHDERYAYGAEWLEVVRRLMAGENVTWRSQHFDVKEYQLRPSDPYRARPTIYVGGESEAARKFVSDLGDVWFINGQPLDDVKRLMDDIARRPRSGPPVRFGMSTFVIARPTRAEAEAEHRRLVDLVSFEVPLQDKQRQNVDPKVAMLQHFAKRSSIGTNGGTAAGLVGSYDEVAERIQAFNDNGIELFMLQFQPFEAEMRRFAEEIIPRVRTVRGGLYPQGQNQVAAQAR